MGGSGGDNAGGVIRSWFVSLVYIVRTLFFRVMRVGPVPNHVAFILDGNRRYSKKHNLGEGYGHVAGFESLLRVLKYCYELGIKYVTIFAFSIDNFRRQPGEVQYVMDLMQEKMEGLLRQASVVREYGVRVLFVGDLKLLPPAIRLTAEKVMRATAHNDRSFLLICVAYTSSYEMVRAVEQACHDKGSVRDHVDGGLIRVGDIEKRTYMSVAPEPDIVVRSSGAKRLSNFLLWQTGNCLLYSPKALWPEMGFNEIVWAVLNYQRHYAFLEKNKKQL